MQYEWMTELEKPPTELEEVQEAIEIVDAFLEEDAPWWEEARQLAAELHKATDEMNNLISGVQRLFREKHVRPAWVHVCYMGKTNNETSLCWNGNQLMIEIRKDGRWLSTAPILNASREVRVRSMDFLSKLYEAAERGAGVS